MNNELKIFENEKFGRIRSVMVDNEPYFVGKDIAEALGYKNTRDALNKHVDSDDKRIIQRSQIATIENYIPKEVFPVNFVNAEIPTRGFTFINESGIYALIFGSKMPDAKDFKHWVTSEVLPSIRKHGTYMTDQKIEDIILNPDTVIKLAQELKSEREEKKRLAEKVEFDKPKVTFANSVIASKRAILVRELAKLLKQNHIDIGQNRLYKWLRENGYIVQKGLEPTQKSMNLQLFEVEETVYFVKNAPRVNFITKVTPKGQVYFINKLTKERDYVRG